MEEAAGFLERHQWLQWALLLLFGSAMGIVLYMVAHISPPLFSVAVSGFEGLDRRSSGNASAPPTFHVVLRVENNDYFPRHCFTEVSAVVELDGVPLARAHRFDGFCVPGQSAVDVPFMATGGGLGLPDGLYERVREAGLPSLEVRVRLDGDALKRDSEYGALSPMLLRCTATLDGRPSDPCSRFLMVERDIIL